MTGLKPVPRTVEGGLLFVISGNCLIDEQELLERLLIGDFFNIADIYGLYFLNKRLVCNVFFFKDAMASVKMDNKFLLNKKNEISRKKSNINLCYFQVIKKILIENNENSCKLN